MGSHNHDIVARQGINSALFDGVCFSLDLVGNDSSTSLRLSLLGPEICVLCRCPFIIEMSGQVFYGLA